MICRFIYYLISPYKDGELSSFWKGAVSRHLDHCGRCNRILDELNAADDLLDQWVDEDAPGHLSKAVSAGVDAYERGKAGVAPHIVYKPNPKAPLIHEIIFNRRPAYAFARVAIALILVFALTFTMLPDRSIAQAVEVSGVVLVAKPGQDAWRNLSREARIYEGMKVRFTSDTDYIDLRLARSGEVVRVKKVPAKADGARRVIKVHLFEGSIDVHSEKRAAPTRFKVHTPTRIVEVESETCVITASKDGNGTTITAAAIPE